MYIKEKLQSEWSEMDTKVERVKWRRAEIFGTGRKEGKNPSVRDSGLLTRVGTGLDPLSWLFLACMIKLEQCWHNFYCPFIPPTTPCILPVYHLVGASSSDTLHRPTLSLLYLHPSFFRPPPLYPLILDSLDYSFAALWRGKIDYQQWI